LTGTGSVFLDKTSFSMKVAFRVDDIFLNGSSFELGLLKSFHDKKIPLTLGVIPFTKEGKPVVHRLDDQTRLMLESGYFEIALHGYKHLQNNDWGEFYGIPYEKQLEWISTGKSHLEQLTGRKISTFIPPWNAADLNTLNAVHTLGFDVISLGHHPKTNHLKSPKISIIPYSVEHLFILNTIFFRTVRLLFGMRLIRGRTVVVLFHPYNILEWSSTNPYLKNDKSKFVVSLKTFDETLLTLAEDKSVKFSTLQELNTFPEADKTLGFLLDFIHKLFYRRVFKLLK
jgi:peptidoglycan/xylan/chitin deacetylase (PgdA/CDA1 family)